MNKLFNDLFEKINFVQQKYNQAINENQKSNNDVNNQIDNTKYEISYLDDFQLKTRYKNLLFRTKTLINKISHDISNSEIFEEEAQNEFNELLIQHNPPSINRKKQMDMLTKIHKNEVSLNSIDDLNKFMPEVHSYDDKLYNQLIEIFKQSLLKSNNNVDVEEYLKQFEFDFKNLFVDLVRFFISKNVTIPKVDFYPTSKQNVDKKFNVKFYKASNSEITSNEIEQLLTFGLYNKDLDHVLVKSEVVLKD